MSENVQEIGVCEEWMKSVGMNGGKVDFDFSGRVWKEKVLSEKNEWGRKCG